MIDILTVFLFLICSLKVLKSFSFVPSKERCLICSEVLPRKYHNGFAIAGHLSHHYGFLGQEYNASDWTTGFLPTGESFIQCSLHVSIGQSVGQPPN